MIAQQSRQCFRRVASARSTWNVASASEKSGCACFDGRAERSKSATARSQIARTSGAIGAMPRSPPQATRRGGCGYCVAVGKCRIRRRQRDRIARMMPRHRVEHERQRRRHCAPSVHRHSARQTAAAPDRAARGRGSDETRPPSRTRPAAAANRRGRYRSRATPHRSPTPTAEPPDEPPQVKRVSHGLSVWPKTSLTVVPPAPNSGVLILRRRWRRWLSRLLNHEVGVLRRRGRQRRAILRSSACRQPR